MDALYIGGGFPELFARGLEANWQLRSEIKNAIDDGLPVYAECAGLLYLSERLTWDGQVSEMVKALPAEVSFSSRPEGHGYVVANVVTPNPFFSVGERLCGHEFNYAKLEMAGDLSTAYELARGHGLGAGHDAIVYKNVLASFMHLHAAGVPGWARAFVDCARSGSKLLRVGTV